jgi:penicillin-binding protein 2
MVRTYPYGALTSHVVGYVGRISETDLQTLDPAVYAGTLHIGKSGLEKSYEAILHGKTGYEEIETDATGRPLRTLGSVAPMSGADLRLALDIKLQKLAYDALGDHNGAVVALEPRTGRVLAMASKPVFDPNPFVNGIRRADYQALNADPDRPLYDRVLRGLYPPGSTIKPFVGLAGLETAELNPARREICPGYFQLPGSAHRYRDWRKGGHGLVDLKYGITQSCDVYFYKLALRIGIDKLHDYMNRFGFGRRTGVDLDGETEGLFPSREWKERRRKQPWMGGETVITGIGQGYVQASPLQLARATAIMANRGLVISPRLVDSIRGGTATRLPLLKRKPEPVLQARPEHWKIVIDAMVDVVHSGRGTATRISYGLPFHVAGKTGTAQVFTVRQNQSYKSMKVAKKLQDHALFVAFAPAEDPKIAVAVVVENGGHGSSVAAPIARDVMTQYLQSGP